jgi:uncharacterized membrane protein
MKSERWNKIAMPILDGLSALYTLLRSYFLTGIIVFVPGAVTLYITFHLFIFADSLLGNAVNKALGAQIPGVGLFSTMMVFMFAGMVAQNVFGRRFISWLDISLQSLPGVRSLYNGVKQVSDVLFQRKAEEFQRVVLVQFPMEGSWALGFVTGDFPRSFAPGGLPSDLICVFIPTTPNPTSGYMLVVSKSRVIDTHFDIEDAMKMIISGGMVTPGSQAPAPESPIYEDFTIPR